MKYEIESYLESKKLAWAPSTLKSEKARLTALADVLNGDPQALWDHMEVVGMGRYTRQTTWVRVIGFWQHLNDRGLRQGNPYRAFRTTNARLFKNVYNPRLPEITYEEAKKRIETISEPSCRRRALEILGSGTRWQESETHSGGVVSGKGGKQREVYVPKVEGPKFEASYRTFLRCLAEVGLTPHMLRKIFLSKMAEDGASEFELMEVAGWNSIGPARAYIKVHRDKVRKRVEKIQKGGK